MLGIAVLAVELANYPGSFPGWTIVVYILCGARRRADVWPERFEWELMRTRGGAGLAGARL
eukprot:267041-Pyramimonas_sp.AAC.1